MPLSDKAVTSYKYYWLCVIAYVTFQLISDVTAGKIIGLGPAVVSVTVLYFPFTYLISDILTEVYGYERARRALWVVLLASVTAGVIYQLVVALPPGPGFDKNASYSEVLGQVPRILIAGWVAVFSGDIANNFIMSRMKLMTKGRYLWLRTITSTIVGQGINTAVFYIGALMWILPDAILLNAILWAWLMKVAVEILLTPLTYYFIGKLKRAEGIDTYDEHANYNPFKLS
jgi:uncharacterized integral membrane protein (TIGR00697 family)